MASSRQVICRRLRRNNLLDTVELLYFTVSFQLEPAVSAKRQPESRQHAIGDSGVLSQASCQ